MRNNGGIEDKKVKQGFRGKRDKKILNKGAY
jgi:hypothetical protein